MQLHGSMKLNPLNIVNTFVILLSLIPKPIWSPRYTGILLIEIGKKPMNCDNDGVNILATTSLSDALATETETIRPQRGYGWFNTIA